MIGTLAEFDALHRENPGKTIVVDFTATWCGPCKAIGPVFEKMAGEVPDVIFVKVDVDENEETASKCGIQAMPTFQAFKDGKQVGEMKGASEPALRAFVDQHK